MALSPQVKLFVNSDTLEGVFGSGKWRLLSAVQEEGSLQKAAARLGRSYRKAWGDIRRAEEGLGQALVSRSRGGTHGGGTMQLTEFGAQLLRAWDNYYQQVRDEAEKQYRHLIAPLVEEGVPGR